MWGFRNRTINSHEIQNIWQFFPYFYRGHSAKILQHRKKERFKISEAAKLNSSLLQTCEEITPQNHEIFTVFCMVGCDPLPWKHASVKLCDYVKLYSQGVLF